MNSVDLPPSAHPTAPLRDLPDVSVGEVLPTLTIPIDRTTIVAAAIASQDFEDVHHDPGKAQERGTPDIFMSINSTNGFLSRFVTDWAGPKARLTSVKLRLGVPLFPGDDLVFTGEVTAAGPEGLTLNVVGANTVGPHVTARVTLVDNTMEGDTP